MVMIENKNLPPLLTQTNERNNQWPQNKNVKNVILEG